VAGRIYSVGYEGFDAPVLVRRLTDAQVSYLVDVRLTPSSRKPGYSRKSLTAALDAAGITYVHEPGLGNPPDNRESFRRGDGEEGRRRMRELLEGDACEALHRVADLARRQRVAVLCVERDRQRCHRDVVTAMVQELDPAIEVLHIL
jgi:uncharacterized protein (DUF488 family)